MKSPPVDWVQPAPIEVGLGAGFLALTIERFPADRLRPRMWELRHHLSGYDATYVALAEALSATALLTTDARLAAAPGARCTVAVL